jgi:DNA-binding GntR family transcriptional regulator
MPSISHIQFAPDLTEQVHQRLLDAICDGELAPGTRLTQEDLAASLNVSRQPVLQALRLLKKEGFVVEAGRRGLMVTPLNAQAIVHLYQVRSALDALAARQAALARAKLDPKIIVEGRKAAAGKRIGPAIEADVKFHNLVYAASGNPLIAEAAHQHWRHIRRVMGAVLQSAGVRAAIWDEHEGILKAINRGDSALADRLARSHGENAADNLAAQLDQHVRYASGTGHS